MLAIVAIPALALLLTRVLPAMDRLTDALSAVPEAEQCGWVKDRFGVSWQIFPRQLIKLIGDADRARAKRAFDAMSQMKRIDIAAIERAADS